MKTTANYINIRDTHDDNLKEVIVIDSNMILGHFIRDVSGHFYFDLLKEKQGLFSDYILEELAYHLKSINKPWNKHLNNNL